MSNSPQDNPAAPVTEAMVVEALRTVYDPEIPVSIYELGLIYDIQIEDSVVDVRMTLTSPACPVAGSLPGQVEMRIKAIEGVSDAKVELVWEPPWTPEKMSEAAKLELNMDIPPAPPQPPPLFDLNPRPPG
jgi:FeS assembly SUF system protein